MRSTEHRHARARARFTTTAVLARTDGGISKAQFAITHRFARSCSIKSFGTKPCNFWKIPISSRTSSRRLDVAQKASPTKRRQEGLQRDLTRVRKSIERLMTAYQEELLSLDELRSRMPDLRQRERAMQAELQSIATQTQDRAAYLRLAETLSAFLSRLRSTAKTLDITER